MPPMISDCFQSARFGDRRLTNRLVKLVDRLSSYPNLSIPGAMKVRADTEAAYRFFDNPRVTRDAILEPHVAATKERIRQSQRKPETVHTLGGTRIQFQFFQHASPES